MKKSWPQRLIEKGNAIRQAMRFLEDLIIDWSSRVWVISEFHIAKKKNNLKYWFIALNVFNVPFFKFDFTNPAFYSDIENSVRKYNLEVSGVHLRFHSTIINQLNAQGFLKMMLKSKASKNEDRFYAILPQSKYKDQVSQVDQWNITTLISVKLKLFEIMDAEDKWILLFLCGYFCSRNSTEVCIKHKLGKFWKSYQR
ncbi:unnamed protein product [Absidia cylindrospora]